MLHYSVLGRQIKTMSWLLEHGTRVQGPLRSELEILIYLPPSEDYTGAANAVVAQILGISDLK